MLLYKVGKLQPYCDSNGILPILRQSSINSILCHITHNQDNTTFTTIVDSITSLFEHTVRDFP